MIGLTLPGMDTPATDPKQNDSDRGDALAADALSDKRIADENWQRYEHGRNRGHREYAGKAKRLEGYYLGGGLQWEKEDLKVLEEQKRPALEFNEVMPAINAAIGYQIANRMEIGFQPRGGEATQDLATILSKVAMQVAYNCNLHWRETEVFSDGMIQQRGYFDIRIDTDDHMRGEVTVDVLDPLDVIPDPDAKTYEPEGWADVVVTRWYTLDQIEQFYGKDARMKAEATVEGTKAVSESDFGDLMDQDEERNKFGDRHLGSTGLYDHISRDGHLTRLRIIDRQKWVYEMSNVVISPDTGDVRVTEGMDPDKLIQMLAAGAIPSRRMARRVHWTVSTCDTTLFDGKSPYPFFTVVPFFPFFRRGKTRGLVDNAVGPQNALNKLVSQYVHVTNTSANSGWMVEENSLTNMDTTELESNGAKSGLVIEYKQNTTRPEKIKPNDVPQAIDRMIDRTTVFLKESTVPDAARGLEGQEKSGVAIQSRQAAAQQQLAMPLDNLARTRNMLAKIILWMLQNYYDEPRILRITKQNPATGEPEQEELPINQPDPATGMIMNDLRIGEYDVIVTEQPIQVTFENGQFEQALRMKESGVNLPDDVLIRNSALAEKTELLKRMSEQQETKPDPLTEAEIALKQAQAQKARNEAVTKSVEGQYSAIQTAQTIATIPQTAPLADQLLRSAGFQDQDTAPIIPEAEAMALEGLPDAGIPTNTAPRFPANPDSPAVGMQQGIETSENDGAAL